MQRTTIRTWFLIHKWTSIVCTGFLLMLCVTGLPLLFHDEIDLLTEEHPDYGMPGVGSSGDATGLRPLAEMLAQAPPARPGASSAEGRVGKEGCRTGRTRGA